jgi:hypothetical protein
MDGKWQRTSILPQAPALVREAAESDEDRCPAFGYLRGMYERAQAVEFRYRDGNSDFFPYSWLGPWRYNPSVGLLLKFTGDAVTFVLIRGSNLDVPVNGDSANLTDRGLQRHRITWVREMDESDTTRIGDGGPTVDRIEVADFESVEEQRAWVEKRAPAFLAGR